MSLTVSAAAEILGVSIGTLRRWADQGFLGFYRTPGGQRRFDPAELRRFAATLARS